MCLLSAKHAYMYAFIYVRIYLWDPAFYGISDKEAPLIDPQQRMVLDCVQMALDDGSMTREGISGTNTGVYIGKICQRIFK